MIKCKEDLINTYIENDHGELRDLYLAKCESLGFYSNSGRAPTSMKSINATFFGITITDEALSYSIEWSFADNGCKKLTISDLKPKRTRTEYEKVTESIFDLSDEFERGELVSKVGEKVINLESEKHFVTQYSFGYIHRKIEKEIDWRDESHGYLANKTGFHWSTPIAEVINDESDCFLELCRVALRANGEIE